MLKPPTLYQQITTHLGLTKNENLNSNNRLEGWTKYEFTREDGRAYGYNYLVGMVELWLGVDPLDIKYTVLKLLDEQP